MVKLVVGCSWVVLLASCSSSNVHWSAERKTQVTVGPHVVHIANGWRDERECTSCTTKLDPNTILLTPERRDDAFRTQIGLYWGPREDAPCEELATKTAKHFNGGLSWKPKVVQIGGADVCEFRWYTEKDIIVDSVQRIEGDHELILQFWRHSDWKAEDEEVWNAVMTELGLHT